MEEDGKETLQSWLPNYRTKIVSFQTIGDGFVAIMRLKIFSKEQALDWLKQFSDNSMVTFKCARTYPENTQKLLFKKEFLCLHNTRPAAHKVKNPHAKHTGCNAKLTITVKQRDIKKSKDVHLKKYPTEVMLRHTHNHLIVSTETLRHRPPREELKDIFKGLFLKGHSPSSSLEIYKSELQEKYKDYDIKVADGSVCPTRKWCYDLYYKLVKQNCGELRGTETVNLLEEFVVDYNKEVRDNCAAVSVKGNDVVVAICSPLMKRTHQFLKSSSEIVFLDSSGDVDLCKAKVFIMLCASVAGATPLGIFMTYSESEENISRGLELLQSLFPEHSFFGKKYPDVFITDDYVAERKSLGVAYTESKLLLSQFHVLQTFMRYVWAVENGVRPEDRVYIYQTFRDAVHEKEISVFENYFSEMFEDSTFVKYDKITNYLKEMKSRTQEWASCYRAHLLPKDADFCEGEFRVLQDKMLNRNKLFSIVQMFSFLVKNYEDHYKRKLAYVLQGSFKGYVKSKYFIKKESVVGIECVQLVENLFTVSHNDKEYAADTEFEICTCPVANQGAPCKHICTLFKKFRMTPALPTPTADSTSKDILQEILADVKGWYDPLDSSFSDDDDTKPLAIETITIISTGLDQNEEDAAALNSKIDKFGAQLKIMAAEKPSTFIEPIETFINNFQKLKDETSLIGALRFFGESTKNLAVASEHEYYTTATKVEDRAEAPAKKYKIS